MREIWRDIKNYEGLYQISNLGRVKSLDIYVKGKAGSLQLKQGRILKPCLVRSGYFIVTLYKDGNIERLLISRLVATHFVKSVPDKLYVNHIDGDKQNNNYLNLEWCTRSENQKHAYKTGLQRVSNKQRKAVSKYSIKNLIKPVLQFDLNGDYINKFKSIKAAALSLGKEKKKSGISQCCRHERNTAYGYIWEFDTK